MPSAGHGKEARKHVDPTPRFLGFFLHALGEKLGVQGSRLPSLLDMKLRGTVLRDTALTVLCDSVNVKVSNVLLLAELAFDVKCRVLGGIHRCGRGAQQS